MVRLLSEGHWTSTCVVTLDKFQDLCDGGSNEASAVLSHLSGCGKAHKIFINRGELIEVGSYPSFFWSYYSYIIYLMKMLILYLVSMDYRMCIVCPMRYIGSLKM